tara:strand:- start:1732 stop:2409 length:678 start_codon:yes stop_codon:yes gene_type:complete
MKVGVLLSGCGVFDGSEIHEAVCTLLSIRKKNLEYICIAPNIKQHHVINHMNGEQMNQERNVLIESARIARGDIVSLENLDYSQINSLVLVGGFGAAKNLSDWAFNGVDSIVLDEVQHVINHCINKEKPIVSLCISPTLIAKTLEKRKNVTLTLGSTKDKSEYNIQEINNAVSSLGMSIKESSIDDICVDEKNKIITAPCYMMNADIAQLYSNIEKAISKLAQML